MKKLENPYIYLADIQKESGELRDSTTTAMYQVSCNRILLNTNLDIRLKGIFKWTEETIIQRINHEFLHKIVLEEGGWKETLSLDRPLLKAISYGII